MTSHTGKRLGPQRLAPSAARCRGLVIWGETFDATTAGGDRVGWIAIIVALLWLAPLCLLLLGGVGCALSRTLRHRLTRELLGDSGNAKIDVTIRHDNVDNQ